MCVQSASCASKTRPCLALCRHSPTARTPQDGVYRGIVHGNKFNKFWQLLLLWKLMNTLWHHAIAVLPHALCGDRQSEGPIP
jgi:hypothetical protein